MAGVNKVILIGHLGADPEIRYTADGTAVATFRLATTRRWTNKDGERVDQTEWHRIVAWRRLGEICAQYLSKGKQVYIEGRLQTRSWEDRDGNKRWTTEIIADEMQMLGGGGGAGGGGGSAPTSSGQGSGPPSAPPQAGPDDFDDDIPF